MDQSYYFYISYERSECDDYMERFFRDLIAEVSSISGVSRNRVAFLDKHEIGAGDDWARASTQGLAASRTMVAMFSPAYFSRPAPLPEFDLFRSRPEAAGPDGHRSPVIFPVLWSPRNLLQNAPPSADELLALVADSGDYPEEFVDEGLRWVMRRGGRYKRFVSTLAEKIVRVAQAVVLPTPGASPVPASTAAPGRGDPPSDASGTGLLQAFLCHASGDKPHVRELFRKLKEDRVEPWLDEECLLPGQVWEEEIREAVKASHAVIVCLSRHAITKVGYVHKELKFALDTAIEQPPGSMFLIPIKLDDCDIPDGLKHIHATKMYEGDGYSKLKNALDLRAYQLGLQRTRWQHA